MTYKYYINLIEPIIKHQNFLLICRELPTVALSYHVTIRDTSISFTENKKTAFCGCKPAQH